MVFEGIVLQHYNVENIPVDGKTIGGYVPEANGYEGQWVEQTADFSDLLNSATYTRNTFFRVTLITENQPVIKPTIVFRLPVGWEREYGPHLKDAMEISNLLFEWFGDVTDVEVFKSIEGIAFRFNSVAFKTMAAGLCQETIH